MIITVTTNKGGAGKTTTAAAIAQAAATQGARVLGIDIDPQGNFSMFSGARPTAGGGNAYTLITGSRPASECIHEAPAGYDIIPGVLNLSALKTAPGSARRLLKHIESICNIYDYVIIDTPTFSGELKTNGIMAADCVLMPTEAEPAGIQGIYKTLREIETITAAGKCDPKKTGVLITRYDARSKYNQAMHDNILKAAEAAGVPFLGAIRQGTKIKEAQGLALNLYEYAPKCNPARDYTAIFEKIKDMRG